MYQLIYQIGNGEWKLEGDHDWLMAQWDIILGTHHEAKLVSFDILD